MKVITTFLFCLLLFGCIIKHKHEPTKAEKEKIHIDFVEDQLNYSKEKIVLLSVIKGIPYDTLFAILKDYNWATNVLNEDSTYRDFNKALSYTTARHSFSEKKIALIIFSFNYEMMSRDDIIEAEEPPYDLQ